MTSRTASCRCGAVMATCEGEPVRISACHCYDCQRRSGSAFALQARWPEAQVTLAGETRVWEKIGDSGRWARFHFCPACGSSLYYYNEGLPGLVAVAVGAFADRDFPAPGFSVWEPRKHPWLELIGEMEHD